MLTSKIKPCMSKYKQLCTVKLQMAHYISYNLFDDYFTTWITVVILGLIHASSPDLFLRRRRDVFIRLKTNASPLLSGWGSVFFTLVIHSNCSNRIVHLSRCLAIVHSNFCPISF